MNGRVGPRGAALARVPSMVWDQSSMYRKQCHRERTGRLGLVMFYLQRVSKQGLGCSPRCWANVR